MNKIKNNKAFTLIEMLIGITILGVVMLIATSMIIQSFNTLNETSERVSSKQLAEIMLEDITNNLRLITKVYVDEKNHWKFKFDDNYDNNTIEIKWINNEMIMKIDNKKIRVLENIQYFNINIIEKNKNKEDKFTGRIIVVLKVKNESGKIIQKRKEILARNLK